MRVLANEVVCARCVNNHDSAATSRRVLVGPRTGSELDQIAGRPALEPRISDLPQLQLREQGASKVIGWFGLRASVRAPRRFVGRVDLDEPVEVALLQAEAVGRACPPMPGDRDVT